MVRIDPIAIGIPFGFAQRLLESVQLKQVIILAVAICFKVQCELQPVAINIEICTRLVATCFKAQYELHPARSSRQMAVMGVEERMP